MYVLVFSRKRILSLKVYVYMQTSNKMCHIVNLNLLGGSKYKIYKCKFCIYCHLVNLKFTTFIQSFINLGQSHRTFNWFFFSKCNHMVNIKTLWNKFCAESSRNWEDPQIWYSLARWYIDKRTRDF